MDILIQRQLTLMGSSTVRLQTELNTFREFQEQVFREDEPSYRYRQHIIRIR